MENERVVSPRSQAAVVGLMLGYVGIYLCRKNLSVAVPLLQTAFHKNKAEVGIIASVGTATYAAGKMLLGPLTDRIGGRAGFLAALALVALFGALGALAPGIAILAVVYGANRFFGAGGWPGMMKLVPTWFPARQTATVVAVLSLSYVLGSVLASLLAGKLDALGYGWRTIMGFPSLVLLGIVVLCFFLVKQGPRVAASKDPGKPSNTKKGSVLALLKRRRFLVVCGLSFALTLMRETMNGWGVDFLLTLQKQGHQDLNAAAIQSVWFDVAGGASILLMGWAYDRTPRRLRRWLIAGITALLAVVLVLLGPVSYAHPSVAPILVGAVGLLVYGPYSLLAGTLAVETGGAELAASAAGVIDAVGYVASIASGAVLGGLADKGGWGLGFDVLAVVTAIAAVLALKLDARETNDPAQA